MSKPSSTFFLPRVAHFHKNRARPGGETLDRFCAGKHKTKNNQNNRLQTTITFGTFFVLAQPKPILKNSSGSLT
jgi:hypothetical protein